LRVTLSYYMDGSGYIDEYIEVIGIYLRNDGKFVLRATLSYSMDISG